jgi:hypothetical protein
VNVARTVRMHHIVIIFVLGAAVLACVGQRNGLSPAGTVPGPGSVVDGFPIGRLADPVPDPAVAAFAVQALEERLPGHSAVQSSMAYQEDLQNTTIWPDQPVGRSGTLTVYLFHLADGSYHATGVYCGVPSGPPTGLPGDGCRPWPVYKPS